VTRITLLSFAPRYKRSANRGTTRMEKAIDRGQLPLAAPLIWPQEKQ